MPHREVGVIECLFTADSLDRVEVHHLRKQVDGKGVCTGKERREGHARFDW